MKTKTNPVVGQRACARPRRKTSPRRRSPSRKKSPPGHENLFIFDIRRTNLPARGIITVRAVSHREALGAAHILCADFADHALSELRRPAA